MTKRARWTPAERTSVIRKFLELIHTEADGLDWSLLTRPDAQDFFDRAQQLALKDKTRHHRGKNALHRLLSEHTKELNAIQDELEQETLNYFLPPPAVETPVAKPSAANDELGGIDGMIQRQVEQMAKSSIEEAVAQASNALLTRFQDMLNKHMANVESKLSFFAASIDHKNAILLHNVDRIVNESENRLNAFWLGEPAPQPNQLEVLPAPEDKTRKPRVVIAGLKGQQMQPVRDMYSSLVDLVFVDSQESNFAPKLKHADLVIGVVKFISHSMDAVLAQAAVGSTCRYVRVNSINIELRNALDKQIKDLVEDFSK